MKLSIVVVMSFAVCSMSALGEPAHVHPATASSNASALADANASSSHRVVGIVKKVDVAARTVTLDHEAVKSLSWPAMTMTFKIDSAADMRKLKSGAHVKVDMVQRGNDYVVTAVH